MPGFFKRAESRAAPETVKDLPRAAVPKQGELTEAQLRTLRRNVHFAELERKMGGRTRVAK